MTSNKASSPPTPEEKDLLNPEELEFEQLTGIVPTSLTLKETKEHREDFWKEKKASIKDYNLVNCLSKHEVKPKHRAAMVDWMIEVLKKFDCQDITFFKAVAIMDCFYAKTPMYIF